MQSSKDISKWQHIVQQNRQASSLSFPLNAPPALNVTSSSIVASHKPKTEMELEMQQALEAAGMATEGDISKLEEMEMNKLSAAEIEARFAELAKKRSLLFFQERKQKHQSKIKSKKFRKIKAKEQAKETAKKEATLTAQERREKAEMARIKERLTLKTRRANMWAQEMIHRRGLEHGSRQEIVEQLRDKERLRQEIFGRADDERDEEDDILIESEDEGNEKINKEYFGSDVEDEEEQEQHTEEDGSDFETSSEDEEESEKIVGRRTFGSKRKETVESENEEESFKTVKRSKQSKASSDRSALFAVAEDAQLKAQQDFIRQAFENDDLFAEFAAEKDALIEAEAPKDKDLTLPGWGQWAGEGVQSKAPQTRIIKKAAPGEGIHARKRKDANLKHVIINEKQNKKLKQVWMVPKVPFPFKSKEEYEKANLGKPLGPEWNSNSSYNRRITPRVQVKVGSIIDPIKFAKQPKN